MDSFPISCQNCFSHKREFYVFLECKHFMCLSCSLCLADFQNLTVRCCYKNTKMSEQLVSVMFEEVNKRKNLKQSQAITEESMIKELTQIELEKKLSSQSAALKQSESLKISRMPASTLGQMQESKIVHSFKMIDENIYADTIKQSSRINLTKSIAYDKLQSHDPCLVLKPPLKNSEAYLQSQCPTFKRIKSQDETPQTPKKEQVKQNYVCWKNYDNSKDRILAKLNYHQQKINSVIRRNYNY